MIMKKKYLVYCLLIMILLLAGCTQPKSMTIIKKNLINNTIIDDRNITTISNNITVNNFTTINVTNVTVNNFTTINVTNITVNNFTTINVTNITNINITNINLTGDGNNYTSNIGFTGTTTKTLHLERVGMSNLTANFIDLDTTYSSLSEFSNDVGYVTNNTMNQSSDCAKINGALSNLCTIVDTQLNNTNIAYKNKSNEFITNQTIRVNLSNWWEQGLFIDNQFQGEIDSYALEINNTPLAGYGFGIKIHAGYTGIETFIENQPSTGTPRYNIFAVCANQNDSCYAIYGESRVNEVSQYAYGVYGEVSGSPTSEFKFAIAGDATGENYAGYFDGGRGIYVGGRIYSSNDITTFGKIGVGYFETVYPTYPIEITNNISGISLYAQGNISAAGYIDRTKFPPNNYSALEKIKKIKGKDGELNHSTLSNFTKAIVNTPIYEEQQVTKYKKVKSCEERKCPEIATPYNTTETVLVGYEMKEGRDIGASISELTLAIQELVVILCLESNDKYEFCEQKY